MQTAYGIERPDVRRSPSPLASDTQKIAIASGEVAQQAKAVSVLIQNDVESGTGVVIQRQGDIYTVLTAAHVVQATAAYTVTTPDGRRHDVAGRTIKPVSGIDLAVLTFQSDRAYAVAPIGRSQTLGEGNPVYVAGFPLSTAAITQPVYNFTDGKVTARSSQPFADGYAMVYSNSTLPGMSGGGVFNDRGQLVAIHGRGDVDTKLEASSINPGIRVKTGFNLGIPIETFVSRASEVGVTLQLTIPAAPAPSNPADDLLVAAAVKAQQGNYPGAIADLTQAIRQSPQSARLYLARANYYSALGQTSAVLADLDQAIALDTQADTAYLLRANYRHGNRDTAGAIADLTQAIALNRNNPQAYLLRATLSVAQGDPSGAIADYTELIRLDPQNRLAYSARAGIRFQQGDREGAIADYSKLIALNPGDLDAYSNRAHIRKYSGDPSGALADYTAMIKANPRNTRAYEQRASLRAEQNDLSGAIADYSAILAANPRNVSAYYERAQLQEKQGAYQAAIADYSQLIQLQPFQKAWYITRGFAQEKVGDKTGASADFKKVAELAQKEGDAADFESWMQRSQAVLK